MKEKILILVKTYPTISAKYDELVCTAGWREDGGWVRIYPVPFRKLEWGERYKKFQWINVDLRKSTDDPRPESFRPVSDIEPLELVGTENQWARRRKILSSIPVYDDMQALIEDARRTDRADRVSLAMFKPGKIIDFSWKETDPEWPPDKIHMLTQRAKQIPLFGQGMDEFVREFKLVDKLPYKFFYRFADKTGRESRMMITDWEIGMLFWNCKRDANDSEKIALEKVRQKYEDELPAKDLHLILGTTREFDSWASNPFIIIGVHHPPLLRGDDSAPRLI